MLIKLSEYLLHFAPQLCYIVGSLLFIVGTVIGMVR